MEKWMCQLKKKKRDERRRRKRRRRDSLLNTHCWVLGDLWPMLVMSSFISIIFPSMSSYLRKSPHQQVVCLRTFPILSQVFATLMQFIRALFDCFIALLELFLIELHVIRRCRQGCGACNRNVEHFLVLQWLRATFYFKICLAFYFLIYLLVFYWLFCSPYIYIISSFNRLHYQMTLFFSLLLLFSISLCEQFKHLFFSQMTFLSQLIIHLVYLFLPSRRC